MDRRLPCHRLLARAHLAAAMGPRGREKIVAVSGTRRWRAPRSMPARRPPRPDGDGIEPQRQRGACVRASAAPSAAASSRRMDGLPRGSGPAPSPTARTVAVNARRSSGAPSTPMMALRGGCAPSSPRPRPRARPRFPAPRHADCPGTRCETRYRRNSSLFLPFSSGWASPRREMRYAAKLSLLLRFQARHPRPRGEMRRPPVPRGDRPALRPAVPSHDHRRPALAPAR